MNSSLFIQYIEKYFRPVVNKISETINGRKAEEQLLHKTMLDEEYSPDLAWGSTDVNSSVVAADVVSLDSSLPLKSRGTLRTAAGRIPKVGISFTKGEKAISDIRIMAARGADEATIATKILDDTPKAIKGIDIREEIMFQQALSTGYALVEGDQNNGTGVRANFGYRDENSFTVLGGRWSEADAKPLDDLRQLFDKAQADGNAISLVMLSKKYFNLLRNNEQGKRLAANFRGVVVDSNTILPVPSNEAMKEALADEFGATFRTVDSTFMVEKADGIRVPVKPWAEANIVALPSEKVGRLVYSSLVEEESPVEGVVYQKSGTHILVSKYSENNPYREYTTAQSLAIPVIDGASGIYLLSADKIGKVSVVDKELSFAKSGATKTTAGQGDGAITASVPTDATWCTASIASGVLSITCSTNSGAARTTTVTLTDEDGNKATVAVSQAANA